MLFDDASETELAGLAGRNCGAEGPADVSHVARLRIADGAIGYQHVAVDLRGYRLGSLNDALRLRPV